MLFVTGSFLKKHSVDGFALNVLNLLSNYGIDFRLDSSAHGDPILLDKFKNKCESRIPGSYRLIINPACFIGHYGTDSKTIVYTMWDSTLLEPQHAFELNKCK